jgi:hypothetical protein
MVYYVEGAVTLVSQIFAVSRREIFALLQLVSILIIIKISDTKFWVIYGVFEYISRRQPLCVKGLTYRFTF